MIAACADPETGFAGAGSAVPGQAIDEDAVHAMVEKLRPEVNAHMGDLEIVDIDQAEGEIRLRFLGACITCHARAITYSIAILPKLEAIAGVRKVTMENVDAPARTIKRIQSMLLPRSRA